MWEERYGKTEEYFRKFGPEFNPDFEFRFDKPKPEYEVTWDLEKLKRIMEPPKQIGKPSDIERSKKGRQGPPPKKSYKGEWII